MDTWSPPNTEYPPPKADEPELHCAARVGDHEAIRRLVAGGAAVNDVFDMTLDPGGRERPATPLMVAAGSGDGASIETVELLLELGADPRFCIDDLSAATFACTGLGWNYRPGGDAARLVRLLALGSPLASGAEERNRLLCDVARAGDVDKLRVLLSLGLSAKGHFDPVEALERHRASKKSMDEYRASGPDPFAFLPENLRAQMDESRRERDEEDERRRTSAPWSSEIPLFCAAESGNAECVRLLLEAGADARARDSSDRTAMYFAGSVAVARELMRVGVPLEDADCYGWSPLCSALSDSEAALSRVRSLIEAGANVNATHDHGYTVFMSAVGSDRNLEVLRLLVASGADPHALSERGYNAFHAAIDINGEANAEESVRETLSYLKQLGVNIEQRNKGGRTPLARALQEGTGIEVRVLCELGADPNAVCLKPECTGDSCTQVDLALLFHAAVGYESDLKTEALLRAGADPLVEDAEGFTPLVRIVASLCGEAADYEGSFTAFFTGLGELRIDENHVAQDREEFVRTVYPTLHAYVESFAMDIPFADTSDYAEELRKEKLACISLLCAHEAWARREVNRRDGGNGLA